MSCEEFLKKWTFLPPVRYCLGMYSVDAFYVSIKVKVSGESLYEIISSIDRILTDFGSNQNKEVAP